MQHASNEMLMCPEKSALKALFAQKDTVSSHIRALTHSVKMYQDYGIKIPVLFLGGKNPPKVYSKVCLENDLSKIIKQGTSSEKKLLHELHACFSSEEAKGDNLSDSVKKYYTELFDESVLPNSPVELV